ncbi:serine/threonine-protein phosphatase 7 long form homolog [Aegilops tauschii subsp. strangulata]|uniref:serine/threonine-protein phosphatase 7 long form homolog n=1 Tax=Aegilops tauschii subsp. strangulata TaxID=200361 RepID=UPI003CC8C09A
MNTNGCFSDLLWMPHSQHKISKAWENPNISLNVRCHRVGIPFDPLCSPALENLGFYQIAKMRKINVDKYLISALVECWRPETNTFHLPVGEMTITLQDISCLWGLPIHGKPLVGIADAPWSKLVERLLGIPVDEQHMKQKKRRKGDDNIVVRDSQYSLNLGKLRERFHVLPDNPMDREINWHARALVLEILGSIVFTDTSGDGVPAMYLQFMQNLGQPTEYNWGAAALALLYRQLSMCAEKERLEISGPLLLLQLWSWSRLPLGRPKVIFEKPKGEEPDEEVDEEVHLDYNPIFGAKWCAAHAFDVPHNAGTEYYWNQIDLIREGAVHWQPYDDLLEQMPIQVHDDSDWWFSRGLRELKNAAWGIKCATTRGCKKIGKSVLRSCVGNLLDLNLEPRLQSMLTEARLPLKIEDIPSHDDVSYIAHPPSPPKESNSDVFNEWIYSGKGFTTYLKAGEQ